MNQSLLCVELALLDCKAASWALGAGKPQLAMDLVESAGRMLDRRGQLIRKMGIPMRDVVRRGE